MTALLVVLLVGILALAVYSAYRHDLIGHYRRTRARPLAVLLAEQEAEARIRAMTREAMTRMLDETRRYQQ